MENEGKILENWLNTKRWSALDLAREIDVTKQNVYYLFLFMANKINERNAGRKAKYNEPTKPVTFKLPVSKIAEIKAKIYALLKGYERSPNEC